MIRAAAIALILLVGPVLARDRGQYGNVDPAIKAWVKGLTDKKGQNCCSTADGFPAEAENDTVAGHWRVRIEGAWYVVPDEAVLTEPNRLGFPMVWWFPETGTDGVMKPHIRCFLAGALL